MLRPRLSPERSCVCCRSRRRLGRLRASTRVAPQSRSRSLSLSERTEKPPLAASSYCARGIACSESCLSGLFPSARTDQDGPQWVKCGRQIRPWTDFAPSLGSASASNRASKAVVRQVCNTSTPSPSRKYRSFAAGSASRSRRSNGPVAAAAKSSRRPIHTIRVAGSAFRQGPASSRAQRRDSGWTAPRRDARNPWREYPAFHPACPAFQRWAGAGRVRDNRLGSILEIVVGIVGFEL